MSLDNSGSRKHQIEASYLATNLSWNSDYVLTVARDDRAADLDGWVTVVNNSGTAFRNARLQLVAGELNRVADRTIISRKEMNAPAPAANGAQVQQEAFSDNHLDTLDHNT